MQWWRDGQVRPNLIHTHTPCNISQNESNIEIQYVSFQRINQVRIAFVNFYRYSFERWTQHTYIQKCAYCQVVLLSLFFQFHLKSLAVISISFTLSYRICSFHFFGGKHWHMCVIKKKMWRNCRCSKFNRDFNGSDRVCVCVCLFGCASFFSRFSLFFLEIFSMQSDTDMRIFEGFKQKPVKRTHCVKCTYTLWPGMVFFFPFLFST